MADQSRYLGVNYKNLRKALYLLLFGADPIRDKDGKIIGSYADDFNSPKYKYILPLQGNFENPLNLDEANNTYLMYWIERDKSLTQDDYIQEGDTGYNRQKCVASIILRFIGKDAEDWVKSIRHLTKRKNVTAIWSGVCNAERLEYTSPVIPRRLDFYGKNSTIAFDISFKLYYDEVISTGWEPLAGINFKIEGNITVEEQ